MNKMRAIIEQQNITMREHFLAGNIRAWADLFAADASFINSARPEPVLGREAIFKMAEQWPALENVIEWQAIDEFRLVIGWRERPLLDEGKTGGWYGGIATLVFNADGLIQEYEGVFNVLAVQAAYRK